MVTAIVLLTVERDKINTVALQIAEIEGVSEVYAIGGRFDMVAIIRAKNNEALADVITGHLLMVEGIKTSETLFALKVYSRHDLESMFSIGFEE